MSGHRFAYHEGEAVNENHETKAGRAPREISFERLRVNHYAHRSREEYIQKLGLMTEWMRGNTLERRIRRSNAVHDETIKAYIPALRERLAAVEERARALGAQAS